MAIRKLDKTFAPTTKEIRYLNKTFPEFRQNLIDFAKVYFPNTYTDFNESSPGMMFIEMASYVGDVLSYYIDSQFKENLIQYAEEEDNIISIAQALGYRIKPCTAATTYVDIYQICPAKGPAGNYEPDSKYFLKINLGAVFISEDFGVPFRTIHVIDFNDPTDRDVTVYSVDSDSRPLTYLLKKKAKIVAGEIKTYTTTFGAPQKFSKIIIDEEKVLDIVSVDDANGYKWYQVDYLAQDLVFEDKANVNYPASYSSSVAPLYLMKLKKTPRRFAMRYNEDFKAELHFGSGISDDNNVIINLDPKRIANSEYENHLVSTTLDPSDFLSSTSYGLAPSNIEMTVTYTVGGGLESNVPSNSITSIKNIHILNDVNTYSPTERDLYEEVVQSVAVNNPEPATGGKDRDGIEEIRQNALSFFNSQNRLVTHEDYAVRCYAMPGKYGGISKVFVSQEEQLNDIVRTTNEFAPADGQFVDDRVSPNVVNIHLLGYNRDKKLVRLNYDIKRNLRTYLDQYRILTDEIRIFDAFIVNIGIDFQVVVFKNYNINEVLARCIDAIKNFFDIDKWQINQPIILNDLYMEIAQVDGVQSVLSVKIFNRYQFKDGSDYESYIYDIPAAQENGVIWPSLDPCIFEVRYPERDIVGSAIQ